MIENFAVFILTHGRPDTIKTVEALQESGYVGEYFLVVDDLDTTRPLYMERFGDKVITFNKMEYVNKTDTGLAVPLINFAVFARNAIEDFASSMGYRFFGMFDDDIIRFRHRPVENGKLLSIPVTDLSSVIASYIDLMIDGQLACTGFGVVSQYIGGLQRFRQRLDDNNSLRLCYNAYIRDGLYKVDWKLNMCEDRITSLLCNTSGQVWQQLLDVQIDTAPLYGKTDGGNASVYRTLDEFTQVFFPVISNPNSNFVSYYGNHLVPHIIGEDKLCAKIVSGRYKK